MKHTYKDANWLNLKPGLMYLYKAFGGHNEISHKIKWWIIACVFAYNWSKGKLGICN